MWYFRPGYDEKSYTQHGDKDGHPRAYVGYPRLRLKCQFTRALDWPTLDLPCGVIYYLFFTLYKLSRPAVPTSRIKRNNGNL